MILSFFNKLVILDRFFTSLNLWFEINFFFISNLSNNFFETLVSSQSIKSEFFNYSIALKVMSPKFPIGVGIKYNPFLILLLCNIGFTII